jgi:hypothetical protein
MKVMVNTPTLPRCEGCGKAFHPEKELLDHQKNCTKLASQTAGGQPTADKTIRKRRL